MVAPPNTFFGRDRELQALGACVDEHRITTVVGPPGIGKSRLSRAWAADASAHWIPLGTARSEAAVALALKHALRLDAPPELGLDDRSARIGHALAAQPQPRLVLDDVEHLIEPIAHCVLAWLDCAPALRIVATSRALLRVPGERPLELGPLALDDAIALFASRAREVIASFDANAAVLSELCSRLDRLPLALELCAARMDVLAPEDALRRLDARLSLLAGGYRTADPRQRTLRGALDASWELLDDAGRDAWARLSRFADAFDLEDARALLEREPLDAVAALRRASLLLGERGEWRMLASIRAYGNDRLAASREAARAADAHRRWALAREPAPLADLEELARDDRDPETALRSALRLEGLTNFREPAAARLARIDQARARIARVDEPLEVRTQIARARALAELGRAAEGSTAIERAIAMVERLSDPSAEAEAWVVRGSLAYLRGDDRAARESSHRALAIGASPRIDASALAVLGAVHVVAAEFDAARDCYERALAIAERLADEPFAGSMLTKLGFLCTDVGAVEDAERYHHRALAIHEACGARLQAATARGYLGNLARRRESLREAKEHYEYAIEALRALGDRLYEAVFTMDIGVLWMQHGDRRARDALERALELARAVNASRIEALVGVYLVALHSREGRPSEARARLAAARAASADCEGLDDLLRIASLHVELDQDETAVERVRAELGQVRGTHAELGARFLRERLDRLAPPSDMTQVARNGAWFARGAERPIATNTAGRAILAALADALRRAPETTTDAATLIAAAWPGERIAPAAARNRLRVEIAKLRRAGLAPLQTRRGGYLLDRRRVLVVDDRD